MKKIISVFFVFMVFLFLSVVPSFAKVDLTAGVSLRESFNDNIFLTRTDREHDFITTFSPAISLKYTPMRYLDLSLDYGLNFRLYSRHNELNDTSMDETQAIKFKTQIKPLNNLFIDISDIYQRVPIDVRRQVALDNVFVNMTDSNIFSLSPYIQVPLTSGITATVGYGYTNNWYKEGEAIDSESHSAFVTLNKQFPSRLNLGLKYDYFVYRPDMPGDYNRHQGSVSAQYQATQDLIVWGEIGHSYLDFKYSPNMDEGFWNVGTEYKMAVLGGTSIRAAYSVALSEGLISQSLPAMGYVVFKVNDTLYFYPVVFEKTSTTIGATRIKRLDVNITSGKNLKVGVNPYYLVEDEITTSRKDKALGVNVNISKTLTQKLDASLNGIWERQRFLPEDEKARRYSISGILDYKFGKRITAGIGYTFNSKNSNVDANDFHSNIIWVQSSFAL